MTYDYICEACGHAWEAQQPISADPLKDCPQCGAPKAKRQISLGGGFILKGGGWYSDLYSSAKPKESQEGAEASKGSESSDAPTKSEGTSTESSQSGKKTESSGSSSEGSSSKTDSKKD